jgi:hypothetical protein
MTEGEGSRTRVSHESRLLLLTIVVCVVVLFLLARARFPEPPAVVATTVQPLQRLAAEAPYEALAADIQRVSALISDNLIVLRTRRPAALEPRKVDDVLAVSGPSSDVHHVAALRIDATTALAAIATGVRIDAIVGGGPITGSAAVLGVDPVRRIGRLRVPEAPARPLAPVALTALRTPAYVVAVEGTQAGVTFRPIFLGRGDRFSTARWQRPLLPLGGIAVSPGALLFTLTGEFVGCVVMEEGAPAIAGARDVLDIVERLAQGVPPSPATLGIAVQPLTPELSAALRVDRGVVVADVDAAGPAAGTLQPGDVLTAMEGAPLVEPDGFLLRVALRPLGEPVALTVIRSGELLTVNVRAVAALAANSPAGHPTIAFERTGRRGTRVVAGGAEGYRGTGLRPGDLILRAGNVADPTPVRLHTLLANAEPNSRILFVIRRGEAPRIVAVPAQADAARK